jgi:SAM-dependent methyltransferase
MVDRPSRGDVMSSYRLGVEAYERLWSAVILPGAEAVVPWLELCEGDTVLDVGGGTGALGSAIGAAAASVTPIVADATFEMLRIAHGQRNTPAVLSDAMELPVAAGSVNAVVLAYVLFHLSDPLVALNEARRALRSRGRVATVTWASETPSRAEALWGDALGAAGVPTVAARRVDAGLDSIDAISDALTSTGFRPRRVWVEQLAHQWDRESFWGLVTGSGLNRQRLAMIAPEARDELLRDVRRRLDLLDPEDFFWQGEVICGVASRD